MNENIRNLSVLVITHDILIYLKAFTAVYRNLSFEKEKNSFGVLSEYNEMLSPDETLPMTLDIY